MYSGPTALPTPAPVIQSDKWPPAMELANTFRTGRLRAETRSWPSEKSTPAAPRAQEPPWMETGGHPDNRGMWHQSGQQEQQQWDPGNWFAESWGMMQGAPPPTRQRASRSGARVIGRQQRVGAQARGRSARSKDVGDAHKASRHVASLSFASSLDRRAEWLRQWRLGSAAGRGSARWPMSAPAP